MGQADARLAHSIHTLASLADSAGAKGTRHAANFDL